MLRVQISAALVVAAASAIDLSTTKQEENNFISSEPIYPGLAQTEAAQCCCSELPCMPTCQDHCESESNSDSDDSSAQDTIEQQEAEIQELKLQNKHQADAMAVKDQAIADAKAAAKTKAAAEARAIEDAKAAAEAQAIVDAKAAAETKAIADAKAAAEEAKAAADAKAASDAAIKAATDAAQAAEAKAEEERLAEAKAEADAAQAKAEEEELAAAVARAAAEAKEIADAKAAIADAKAKEERLAAEAAVTAAEAKAEEYRLAAEAATAAAAKAEEQRLASEATAATAAAEAKAKYDTLTEEVAATTAAQAEEDTLAAEAATAAAAKAEEDRLVSEAAAVAAKAREERITSEAKAAAEAAAAKAEDERLAVQAKAATDAAEAKAKYDSLHAYAAAAKAEVERLTAEAAAANAKIEEETRAIAEAAAAKAKAEEEALAALTKAIAEEKAQATYEREAKELAKQGHANWESNHTPQQAAKGGELVHKLHHDAGFQGWYYGELVAAWVKAEAMRGTERLNLEQFKVFTEGYRKLDEEVLGAYNALPRQADKIFNCIQALNPDQDGISGAEYQAFADKIYWPTFMAQFGIDESQNAQIAAGGKKEPEGSSIAEEKAIAEAKLAKYNNFYLNDPDRQISKYEKDHQTNLCQSRPYWKGPGRYGGVIQAKEPREGTCEIFSGHTWNNPMGMQYKPSGCYVIGIEDTAHDISWTHIKSFWCAKGLEFVLGGDTGPMLSTTLTPAFKDGNYLYHMYNPLKWIDIREVSPAPSVLH